MMEFHAEAHVAIARILEFTRILEKLATTIFPIFYLDSVQVKFVIVKNRSILTYKCSIFLGTYSIISWNILQCLHPYTHALDQY